MAQILRLGDYFKFIQRSFSHTSHIANITKPSLRKCQSCRRCWVPYQTSEPVLLSSVIGRRSASGVTNIKPDNEPMISKKPKWKKKKTKNSSVNNRIHSDLLKVLNRRAVQLVHSREANQLHRSLVNNFSFMDFPLQTSAELDAISASQRVQMMGNACERSPSRSGVEALPTADEEWAAQLFNFDKQLKHTGTSGHTTQSDVSAFQEQFLSQNSSGGHIGHLSGSGAIHSTSDVMKALTKTSVSELPSQNIASVSLPSSKKQPTKEAKSSSSESRQSVSELPSQNIASVSVPSIKKQPTKQAKPSSKVNAKILKTKKVSKSKMSRHAMMLNDCPDVVDDMLTGGVFLGAEMAKEGHDEKVDEKVQKGLSKQDLKKLKKCKEEMDKFQSNPSKFNYLFNQDLLAFVDACCFAGLESMAHSILKQNHHNRSLVLPGMKRIHDIKIYTKIMHAWAKKGQLGHIRDLFAMLKEDNLSPNLQCYAALWECLGRQTTVDIDMGQGVLDEMEKEGLDVTELFIKSVFHNDEYQVIVKAIRAVNPVYTPKSLPDPSPPTGPLVDNLSTATPADQVVEKNPYAGLLSQEAAHTLLDTQLQRELRGTVLVKSIRRQPTPSHKVLEYRKKLDDVKEEWKILLSKAFERKLRFLNHRLKMEHGMTIYPYFKILEPHDYVQCLMREVQDLASASESFSPSKTHLWKRLSGHVYFKFVLSEKLKNKVPKRMSQLYKNYLDKFCDGDLDLSTHRELWQAILKDSVDGPSLDTPEKIWPVHILLALGKMLYELIIYDLKVDTNMFKSASSGRNMVPAFYTIYRSYSQEVTEEIKPHPVLMKLYQGAELDEFSFDPRFLPMLIPPVPWTSATHGGYLLNDVRLVRIPMQAQTQKEKLEETVATSQLFTVLDSINTLSACAWTINKPVLDTIISVFNDNGDSSLDIPPPASECPEPPKMTKDMTPEEKYSVSKQRQKLRTQKADMYSMWCQELYKLSIANKFRDEVFWFPHNLDFRGRTYPCPPHFNHLGSDITRSILMFAKGKPLGPKGLDWMKIHLINLTGFKKRSPNGERLAYANEMLDEIFDSAEKPFTGNKWWQKSDEPWQTLACCMEIVKAIRSPDPEQYVCHLPIHQDGSCNGLQHYAALGRDKSGAQSVNLWPYDQPQDVYSDVCELVEKERQKDAKEGLEIAKCLKGFVRRKVIKQTVMTTVYGVTRYGAKAQILRQLKDISDFPEERIWSSTLYLTEKTFQCLNQMFSATKDIQDWLTLCAQLISTVCQRPVEWVTPIGLMVLQPYHKPMSVARFGIRSIDYWNYFEKPNTMKQKNAFPPNFIHSLDSTHMMLTALFCMRAGITFVSVHDCFWTHACDVEIMNKICREQFVALHKQPILEDLSKQLIKSYIQQKNSGDILTPPVVKAHKSLHKVLANVPARGDFDLDKVLESSYFFS